MSRQPLFDKALQTLRRRRISPHPTDVEVHVAAELADRLVSISRRFEQPLLIAPVPDHFTQTLRSSGKINGEGLCCATTIPAEPSSYDAIFHLLGLQSENHVQEVLSILRRSLAPDGLLMICCFGGDTLGELRTAWLEAEEQTTGSVSPRVAPMITLHDLGLLIQQAGLALPVVDKDRLTLSYAEALSLMRDVKAMGFSNCLTERSRKPVTRRLLAAVAESYARQFSQTGSRLAATVELFWATGWAPHQNQAKPLRPGSAQISLTAVLPPSGPSKP